MKSIFLAGVALAAGLALTTNLTQPASAQHAAKSKTPTPVAQATPATPANPPAAAQPQSPAAGWVARCGSASRSAPLECAIEQSAVVAKTGQLVALVNIRVPSDTHTPTAAIQLPLGLFLPAGMKLQVDDGKAADMQIQTCDAHGCYASAPLSPEMLAALKAGKEIKISFQNLSKETITVPMPLGDFASAYDKVK
jgi:invasion protein IalB